LCPQTAPAGVRLMTPDLVEKRWPELTTSRRMFFPLLGAALAHPMGEGSGVKAGVSAHFDSMSGPIQVAEPEILSLGIGNTLRTGKHFSLCLLNIESHFHRSN